MTVIPPVRSQVTLRAGAGGMSPRERASLTTMLLERGLEVVCRRDEGIADAAAVDDGAGASPAAARP